MVCQAELRGLGAINEALGEKGGRILAVAVDEPKLSKRVVKNNDLPFPILADVDRAIIKAYGLVHEGGAPDGTDIAIPAHVLVDRDGSIAWHRVSTRVTERPRVKELLNEISKLK